MRIAYVIGTYPGTTITFVMNEMRELVRAGHEIVILPLRRNRRPAAQRQDFPVEILPCDLMSAEVAAAAARAVWRWRWEVPRVALEQLWAARSNPFELAKVLVFLPKALAGAEWLRARRPDRIHAHFASTPALSGAFIARLTAAPFSFTAHAFDIFMHQLRFRNDTLPWKAAQAHRVLCVHRYGLDLMRAACRHEPEAKFAVVRVGIPLDLFRGGARASSRHGRRGVRLLNVGSFVPKKGLDTLVRACARLRARGVAFDLELVGSGPEKPAIRRLVRELGLEDAVTMREAVPQADVARAIRGCDVFVLPSRRLPSGDQDGIPTVLMEALACGKAVVTCPVAGIPELVVDGETGLLVPSDDPEALCAALARLAADPQLRRALGAAGRRTVRRQHDARLTARSFMQALGLETA